MVIKKSVAAVGAIALLAVGYVGGAFIGMPGVNDSLTSGDVGKAQAFKSTGSEEDIKALEEQLKTDTALQVATIESATILSCRINEMDSIANASIKAIEGIKELEDASKELQTIVKKTANAKNYQDAYMQATASILRGESVDNYEQISNNAILSYSILENNIVCCGTFVRQFGEYLEKNKNEQVAEAMVAWMNYGAEDALLSNDGKAMEAWSKAYVALSDKASKLGVAIFPGFRSSLSKIFNKAIVNCKEGAFSLSKRNVKPIPACEACFKNLTGLSAIMRNLENSGALFSYDQCFKAKDALKSVIFDKGVYLNNEEINKVLSSHGWLNTSKLNLRMLSNSPVAQSLSLCMPICKAIKVCAFPFQVFNRDALGFNPIIWHKVNTLGTGFDELLGL